jgi:hypothetical protein
MTIIEEEQGSYSRTPHPHNGYYAGDFGLDSGRPTRATSVMRFPLHATERVLTHR